MSDDQNKTTLAQIAVAYLSNTRPIMLLIHLVYIAAITVIFSTAYVISFHFTSLIHIYEEAHSITSFSYNLKTSVENDNSINSALTHTLAETNGMRAYVYRYHNGLAAIAGVPFFFQTMTHEVISPGTPRIMAFEQRIPASIHIAINNQFIHDRCAMIRDADRDRENQDYYFWLSRGAKHVLRCPIYMSNGDLFGFVGVDFNTDMADPNKTEAAVKQAAAEISVYFANIKH